MSQTVSPPIYLHWNGHKKMLCWLRYTTSQIMKFKDDGLTWISKSIIFEKALSLSSLSHKSGQSCETYACVYSFHILALPIIYVL